MGLRTLSRLLWSTNTLPKAVVTRAIQEAKLSTESLLYMCQQMVLPQWVVVRTALLDQVERAPTGKVNSPNQVLVSLKWWMQRLRLVLSRHSMNPDPRRLYNSLVARNSGLCRHRRYVCDGTL